MSLFEFSQPQTQIRAIVTSRTGTVDRYRHTRISYVRLQVYDSSLFESRVRFSAYIKGLPFHDNGNTPFYWEFIPGDPANGIHPVLRILLARGAYISNLGRVLQDARTAFPISGRGDYFPLALEIFRIERKRLGRGLGEPVEMANSAMLPLPWPTVARNLFEAQEGDSQAFLLATVDQQPGLPRVSHLPDGLLIEKEAYAGMPAWQIRVRTPLDEPAAFAYNLFGPTPPPSEPNAISIRDLAHLSSVSIGSFYTFRIVRSPNVDVEVFVEIPSMGGTAIDFRIEYHVVTAERTIRPGEPEFDLSAFDPPPIETTDGWQYIGLVPEQGSYLNPHIFQFYTLTHENAEDIPEYARTWSTESLVERQVVGDRISIIGRRQGQRLGPIAPQMRSSFTPELQALITLTEVVIGLIPIVGTLYDFASIMYIRATGRSFWGERREIGWLDFLGIAAIGLGLLGESAQASRGMQRIYERAVSRSAPIDDVIRHIDPPLRAQVAPLRRPRPRRRIVETTDVDVRTFSTRGQEIIQQTTRRAVQISRRTTREVERLLDELDESTLGIVSDALVDAPDSARVAIMRATTRQQVAQALLDLGDPFLETILRSHERQRLLRVMSPDFSEFSNELLASGYRSYASKRAARGESVVSPLIWASRQRTGQYRRELEIILGSGYDRRLRRARALGTASDLNQDGLRVFLDLRQEILTYTDMVTQRSSRSSSMLDLGAFFDADHLLEKRFINHLRDRLPDFDTGSLNSLLVPKNQSVMRRSRQLSTEALNTYDHATKTQLMRTLIPYGEQHLFSLQQWWDAHVWVYRQLEVPDHSRVINALEGDFQTLSRELGESFTPRREISDLDLMPSNQRELASSLRRF